MSLFWNVWTARLLSVVQSVHYIGLCPSPLVFLTHHSTADKLIKYFIVHDFYLHHNIINTQTNEHYTHHSFTVVLLKCIGTVWGYCCSYLQYVIMLHVVCTTPFSLSHCPSGLGLVHGQFNRLRKWICFRIYQVVTCWPSCKAWPCHSCHQKKVVLKPNLI